MQSILKTLLGPAMQRIKSRAITILLNLIPLAQPCQARLIRLGSSYGGWWVIEDELKPGSVVISCGAGEDISFDVELANKYGCVLCMVDPTPRAITHIQEALDRLGLDSRKEYANDGCQPAESYDLSSSCSEQFELVQKAAWGDDELIDLNPPKNPSHVSYTVDVNKPRSGRDADGMLRVQACKISEIAKKYSPSKVEIIKLDIEGAECVVIEEILFADIYPSQILVEYDMLKSASIRNVARLLGTHRLLMSKDYRLVKKEGFNFSYSHRSRI